MQLQEKASGEKHVCTTHSTGSLKASTFKWVTKYCASRMYDQPKSKKEKEKLKVQTSLRAPRAYPSMMGRAHMRGGAPAGHQQQMGAPCSSSQQRR
jgi:hypothetical protein